LIERLGYRVIEKGDLPEENRCCGLGGIVGLTNQVLAFIIGQERTDDITQDVVTYCATCREALIQFCPTIHVLDLLFNPEWKQAKENPSSEDSKKRENFIWLKSQLEKGDL
jgi:hypothetical protein